MNDFRWSNCARVAAAQKKGGRARGGYLRNPSERTGWGIHGCRRVPGGLQQVGFFPIGINREEFASSWGRGVPYQGGMQKERKKQHGKDGR